jgi:hypothetical protein
MRADFGLLNRPEASFGAVTHAAAPIELVFRITILDHYVLALDIAGFLQALEKPNGAVFRVFIGGLGAEVPDHWHRPLLGARRKRQSRRASEPRNELSAPH